MLKMSIVPQDAKHLGGYIAGGDNATYYPDLWDWLVNGPLEVKSVIDVGCGEGIALRHFRELGASVVGVEGVAQPDEDIYTHDYTIGPFCPYSADLVWSCEFVEHVDEKFIPNFLATFKAARTVLMTHAFPGQAGHHHVNCRDYLYWIGVMAGAGFRYDAVLSERTRELAAMNPDPWNHYARSGLAFTRH